MATGRTTSKHARVYVDGYDLSGYTRSIGPLLERYDEAGEAALTDGVKGYLPNHGELGVGTLNGLFDNTATSGLHVLATAGAGSRHIVTVAQGIRAAPAIGDPCYAGHFEQAGYVAEPNNGMVFATVPFDKTSAAATTRAYGKPWGVLLNAGTARTGANSATGGPDWGLSTAFGGFMAYHVLASSGALHTATISIDDSADDSTYNALSGATTGSITVTAGVSGIVAVAGTVNRYLRWQLSLGTATSVTFVLSFHRALF